MTENEIFEKLNTVINNTHGTCALIGNVKLGGINMKKFNYYTPSKCENYIEEFVCSTSNRLSDYLNYLQNQIPKDSDELHHIICDLLLTKDALSILQSPGFHDSNEYIPIDFKSLLYSQAYHLSGMIDQVIIKLLKNYFSQNGRI